MFAIVDGEKVVKYPTDPRYDFPHVSFPENWQGGEIEGVRYVVVNRVEQPNEIDGWSIQEDRPEFINGVLTQKWKHNFLGFDYFKRLIAEKRYMAEICGLMINGVEIQTDRDTQTKYSIMALNGYTEVNWKLKNGKFAVINVKEVNKKVLDKVQKCFNREKELLDIIDKNDIEELKKIDLSRGWF
jgi:hypothetical protein